MFASRTLVEHLGRGLAAVLAMMTAATMSSSAPNWISIPASILLACSALLLLRGCPVCWIVGLVETLGARRSRGACAPTTGDPDRAGRWGA